MTDTTRIVITLTDNQRAAIDAALEVIHSNTGFEIKLSDFIRNAVGVQVETHGIKWPDSPKVGGAREKKGKGAS